MSAIYSKAENICEFPDPHPDQSCEMSRLTDLLDAHADMVDQSTEAPVIQMSRTLEQLTDLLTESTDKNTAANAVQLIGQVQMHMQFQDIVRQQINVVRFGLMVLAQARPPEGVHDLGAWVDAQIKRLESTYVMQDQWNIHNTHLGIEVADDDDDDMTLF